jgi:hypothetical protein
MRRVVLALAMTVGLAIGTVAPASALDTSITLNCSDGTSVKLVVDADTLTALTQAVQAMIDYPAGLSCTLIQNPLGVSFGAVVLAGSGNNPFIVGGGRWQVATTCEALGVPPPPPPPNPAPPPPAYVDSGSVARIPGSWSYWSGPLSVGPTLIVTPTTIFVNIAVNVHQRDVTDPNSFFGTLNETIPNQTTPECGTIGERHFTSKPTCAAIISPDGPPGQNQGYPRFATVTSHVTQTSGLPFPGAADDQDVHFSFIDNGNPGKGGTDLLQGPPTTLPTNEPLCPAVTGAAPIYELVNGNISIHP